MISYFRKKAGLTQKILSEKLKISKRTMSTYENNASSISFEIFYKITKVLKLTEKEIAHLFNG